MRNNAKLHLSDMTRSDLAEFLDTMGIQRFQAGNIFTWYYQRDADSFQPMTNLSKLARERLDAALALAPPTVADIATSADGTRKLLFRLDDGEHVESVIMNVKGHVTLCVSSQVGCRMGCAFCLTGQQRFVRNLRAREIVGQVVACKRLVAGQAELTNVVLMGMGEPLDNFDEVMPAVRILCDDFGLQLSWRRLTLSTAGYVPGLERLSEESAPEVALAVSLNAADDKTRSKIMPINKAYPMAVLKKALLRFPMRGHRRITFEYVLLGGVNDSLADADRLARYLEGIRCMVNLIVYNAHDAAPFTAPDESTVLSFQERLRHHGYRAIVRHSRGGDILAACGQLRGKLKPAHVLPGDDK